MLDPSTFTPQNLLTLARVTLTAIADGEGQLVIQLIPRPSESTNAGNGFTFRVVNDEDLEDILKLETCSWQSAIESGWRIVQG